MSNLINRAAVLALLGTAAVAAQAQQFTYSFLATGDLGLVGISNAQILTVGGPPITTFGPTAGLIDFSPSISLAVGDGTSLSFQNYSFTYQVQASPNVGGVDIALAGTLGGSGKITFNEDVFRLNPDDSETLVASFGNTFSASGKEFSNGTLTQNGNSYTYEDATPVLPPLDHYKIKKTFFLEVNPDHSTSDFASIGLIEQSHEPVPEPATFGALLIGALGIIARRRRQR